MSFFEIQRFQSVELLNQFVDILECHDIQYQVEDTSYAFDITFTKSQMGIEYILKVRKEDMTTVRNLLNQNIDADLDADDYYLNSFSNDELTDVAYLTKTVKGRVRPTDLHFYGGQF